MKSELTYLLEELELLTDDEFIQVKDLIKIINKSFKTAERDQEQIENSMSEIGHDMYNYQAFF